MYVMVCAASELSSLMKMIDTRLYFSKTYQKLDFKLNISVKIKFTQKGSIVH